LRSGHSIAKFGPYKRRAPARPTEAAVVTPAATTRATKAYLALLAYMQDQTERIKR